jgi:hypothetical protein
MNDDEPQPGVEALKAEHRRLDQEIQDLCAEFGPDNLDVARLKKRKLVIKDRIQQLVDASIPDIIA